MNKKLITIGILILICSIVCKLIFCAIQNIELDDFKPAAVIFVVDSSAYNQQKLDEEIKYLKSVCAILDPEDSIKILTVTDTSYLIYEGAPTDGAAITNALEEFTKSDTKEYNTSYGIAIKKAFEHSLNMKKEGFRPSIVVIGALEENGDINKQIDWETLPENVKNIKKYIPEISMLFAYADPEKLDYVKTKLNPVLGEKKLIVVNEHTVNKSQRRLLEAIGR